MARLIRVLEVSAICGLLFSCTRDPITLPTDVIGTYDMVEVDGEALPYRPLFQDESNYHEVLQATIEFKESAAFALVSRHRFVVSGEPQLRTDSLTGAYTVTPSSIRLTAPAAEVMELRREGEELHMQSEGRLFVFRRQ